MKEELFSFNHNGIEYHVMKKNNEYIPYKVVNKVNNYNLTQEEFDLVNEVFNKIKVTNNMVKLSDYSFHGNKYQHLYDKTNNWHLFFNLDGSTIDKKIFEQLNMLFNYQDDKVYDNPIDKKEKKLQRMVKAGKSLILVLVTSSALISPFTSLSKAYAKNINTNIQQEEIIEEDKEELSNAEKIENLKQAILNNKKLNKREKKLILNDFDILVEHIDYIDYEGILKNFTEMDIVYDENPDPEHIKAAYWSQYKKIVYMYNTKSSSELKNHLSTFQHELKHAKQNDSFTHSGIFEPITSILTNEYNSINELGYYSDKYCLGYSELFNYIYTLSKVVSKDALLHAYYQNDYSFMKQELMELIDDESKYYDLLSSFDFIFKYMRSTNKDSLYEKYRMSYIIIESYLNQYYEKKYGKSIYEDVDLMCLLHDSSLNEYYTNMVNDEDCEICFNYIQNPIFNDNIEKQKPSVKINYAIPFKEGLKYLLDNNLIDKDKYDEGIKKYNKFILNNEDDYYEFMDYIYSIDGVYPYGYADETIQLIIDAREEEMTIDDNLLVGKKDKILKYVSDNPNNRYNIGDNIFYNILTDSYEICEYSENGIKYVPVYSQECKDIFDWLRESRKIFEDSNIICRKVGDILSISIYIRDYDVYDYFKTYAINLKNQKTVSAKKLLKKNNITKKELAKYVKEELKRIIKNQDYSLYSDIDGRDIRSYATTKELLGYIYEDISLFKTSYINCVYYNENGVLCVKVPISDGHDICTTVEIEVPYLVKEQVKTK